MRKSRKIIKNYKPDIAIGVGGYASGPIVKAAARKNIPILIQEQNSYAGLTNRILSKSARKICVAYDGMDKYFPADKIILTGNPIRQNLILGEEELNKSYKHFGLNTARKVVLLIGGSLGARTLNDSIIKGIDKIAKSDIQILWQSGAYYYEEANKILESSSAKNIILVPFIKEMNRAFQVANIIISRAGAGTISELCLIGKPVILVPSPNVAEDHQTSNAKALTDQQAAIFISDKDAREELVKTAISLANDDKQKKVLSENIRRLAIPDSSDRIANEVIKILSN